MSNFKDKRLNLSDYISTLPMILCIGSVILSRLLSSNTIYISTNEFLEFWFLEMLAITIGLIFIRNLKVRFYLFLAAVLTYVNSFTYELLINSPFGDIGILYYLFDITLYACSYVVFKYGPIVIGQILSVTLQIDTGSGYFINSTDVYIVKLNRYTSGFHCLVFFEYLIRHSNPFPELYDTSHLLILYNLLPFSVTLYLAVFYGLLIREFILAPKN